MTLFTVAWALVLILVVLLTWRTISVAEKRSSVVEIPPSRAVDRRVVIVGRQKEIELELSDGRRFRSEGGIVWYGFPSGERVRLDIEEYLESENNRLGNLDRWLRADE